MAGGFLVGGFFCALIWVEMKQRRGMEEQDIPWMAYFWLIVPLLVALACMYFTFKRH